MDGILTSTSSRQQQTASMGAHKLLSDCFVQAHQAPQESFDIGNAAPLRFEEGIISLLCNGDDSSEALSQSSTAPPPVVVIAITHDKRLLDGAVLRPGRLDTHVSTELPSVSARRELLKRFFARSPCEAASSSQWLAFMEHLATATAGWSPADIEAIWHEAAMNSLRRSLIDCQITLPDVEGAFATISGFVLQPHIVPAGINALVQRIATPTTLD
jgi:SpoVK/Ycf46/Vps4 family AAA+-type ATPase